MNNNDLRNCIIKYKGGGCEGEFWAWNLCFVDKDNKFRDVFSWGFKQIKSLNELEEYIKNKEDDYYLVKIEPPYLNNQESLDDFYKKDNPEIINEMFKWLFENISKEYMQPCSICDNKKDPNELISGISLGYYYGCGGIAITTDLNSVCEDCVCSYSCSNCGEFYNPKEEIITDYCEYCKEK